MAHRVMSQRRSNSVTCWREADIQQAALAEPIDEYRPMSAIGLL
jgi:hypothetical protein